MMLKNTPGSIATAVALLAATARLAAHEHVAVGADSLVPGSPLVFVSDDDFGADTGFAFALAAGTQAPYAGYYIGELTFAALASTGANGGPEPLHAAPGSHIEVVLESVSGPAGGVFAFWETPGNDEDATEVTFAVPVGETGGNHRFVVSENHGEAGADPYGHIHGRIFSATKPGLYQVGFHFVDTSTNGPAGGPIHAPSEKFLLNFQAGLTLSGVAPSAGGYDVTFATVTGQTLHLESTTVLGDPKAWKSVGDAVAGDDHLHVITVPATATAYFRLVVQ